MADFFKHLIQEFELPLSNPVLIFSLILMIILLTPIILRKLNIPSIIGLIISGLIIGPHGFGVLEKNSAVDLFSTIGLLYLMFIAGLELDLNEFKVNKNKSMIFGFFTLIIPTGLGYLLFYYILNYDLDTSLIISGMLATHTLVTYPIVSRLGISKNQVVAITVGGTILADTTVLLALAIILANHNGILNSGFWLKLGISFTFFSLIMFVIIPRLAKWFFQKLESEKHAHYIFVLSVVFFAAFLAQVAGVEPIIGAFVAGLALNRLIPHTSALMNRIEFIGNAIFIPFFLISVGMMVDVGVLLKGSNTIVFAIIITFTALIGKWLSALVTQICFKYSKDERQLIFGLSSARVAATLAIVIVGYNANIVEENILNGTILMILLTSIVASFVTEKAAKRIVLSGETNTPTNELRHNLTNENLLIPVANYKNIEKLLEFAILIKDPKSSNPIFVLSVVPNDEEAEINILKFKQKINEFISIASATETKINPVTTIDYNVGSGISRASRELMANIVIIGWPNKTDLIDKFFGETADYLIEHIDKNLIIYRAIKPMITISRIILFEHPLIEKEKGFELIIKKLVRIAKEFSIPVKICYSDDNTKSAIEEILLKFKFNLKPKFELFDDWDNFESIRKIEKSDLLIFNSSRHGSISHVSIHDKIPVKLEKKFPDNNIIIVYPQSYKTNILDEMYEDITSDNIVKGIETIEQIGKGIGKIFHKKQK
jgi:Kef-type K+ transport system membrane component KefB